MEAHVNPTITTSIKFSQISSLGYDIIFKDIMTKNEENSTSDYYMATGIRFGSIHDELLGHGNYKLIFQQAKLFLKDFKVAIFDDEKPIYRHDGVEQQTKNIRAMSKQRQLEVLHTTSEEVHGKKYLEKQH